MANTPLTNAQIAEAAFYLWLEEGQPEGRDQDHWIRARQTLEAAQAAPKKAAKTTAKPRKTAAKTGDKTTAKPRKAPAKRKAADA